MFESLRPIMPAMIAAVVLVGTVAGGVVQRQYDSRTTDKQALERAAGLLNRQLPDQVGNWRLLAKQELSPEVVKMLRCPAHLNRVYVHDQTGDRITVAVIVGPAGPVSVHTPEICYSSRDFAIQAPRTVTKITDKTEAEHTLWSLRLNSNDPLGPKLQVFYGWSQGANWEAVKDPRFKYSANELLYKIQLARPVTGEVPGFDPDQDFLLEFLSQLRTRLLSADPA